jgi:hypothetical protein
MRQSGMHASLLPVMSVFAAGLAYAVLPHGVFGTYDVASRAAVTAAVASLVLFGLSKRFRRPGGSR